MKKLDISKHVRSVESMKNEGVPTTVHLTKDQRKFIKDSKINFSSLVRDFVQSLINEQKKK